MFPMRNGFRLDSVGLPSQVTAQWCPAVPDAEKGKHLKLFQAEMRPQELHRRNRPGLDLCEPQDRLTVAGQTGVVMLINRNEGPPLPCGVRPGAGGDAALTSMAL